LPLAESDPETPRASMAALLPADKGTLRRRRSARLGTRDDIDDDGVSGDDEKVLNGTVERPKRGKRSKSKDGKAESGHRGSGLSEARRKVREKMKSPLISGLKLDGIREQISKGVEVK
jgi:hypothetical protein